MANRSLSRFFNSFISWTTVTFVRRVLQHEKQPRGNRHGTSGLLSETLTVVTSTHGVQLQTKTFQALQNAVMSILRYILSMRQSFVTLAAGKVLKNKAGTTENGVNNGDSRGVEKFTVPAMTSQRHMLFRLLQCHRDECIRRRSVNHNWYLGLLRRWTV